MFFIALHNDYNFWIELFNQQAAIAGDDATTDLNYIEAIESGSDIGGLVNNWIPYNKGCWNAITDLVESVGQFTTALRYFSDGTAEIVVVERT